MAASIKRRAKSGRNFSVIAIAEGARDVQDTADLQAAEALKKTASSPEAKAAAAAHKASIEAGHRDNAFKVATALEQATGLESRVTILGYVQRGGIPDANDRLLGTLLGSAGADLVAQGRFGITVASQAGRAVPVPLGDVAGNLKIVPRDHAWIRAARGVGTGFGD